MRDPINPECAKIHTPEPTEVPPFQSSYTAWHDWAAQMSKTHRQVQCPYCGLWAIWLPKAEAKAWKAAERQKMVAMDAECWAEMAEKIQGKPQ